MEDPKDIYLKGDPGCFCGPYEVGTVVIGRRSRLELIEGEFYTIKKIVDNGCGSCNRNKQMVFEEIGGFYVRKDVRVTEESLRRANLSQQS